MESYSQNSNKLDFQHEARILNGIWLITALGLVATAGLAWGAKYIEITATKYDSPPMYVAIGLLLLCMYGLSKDIIAAVRENDAIRQIAVTTNGYRLERDVASWRDAGLTGINVSVDSLDARQFHAITGQDKFNQVMAGIDAAFEAGFEKVKVNTVLMRDVNHHQLDTFLNWIQHRPIQLRFIELMETGEGSELFRKHHISGQVLRDELLRRGWIHQLRQRSDGPAQVFCHPDYAGEIGLIMPYEKDFCATCNRLRVSSIGKLHLCLFGEGGVNLRDLLEDDTQQQALEARISAALREKKQTHFLHQNNTGITQNLSYIGG